MRRTGAETLANAVAAGWTTSLDTGHDTRGEWMTVLEPCLENIGLLFANEAEALKISGCSDVRSAARLFLDRGVGTVVLKRGGNGCAVFDGNAEIWVSGFAVDTVDTTGAGDGFTGGFRAEHWSGGSVLRSRRAAQHFWALSLVLVRGGS